MKSIRPLFFCISSLAILSGCHAIDPCDEFAAPRSRQVTACPEKPETDKVGKPVRYCYSTLGQVDCYTEPQPGRTGYLGSSS